jgi:hypothetical protein
MRNLFEANWGWEGGDCRDFRWAMVCHVLYIVIVWYSRRYMLLYYSVLCVIYCYAMVHHVLYIVLLWRSMYYI